MFLYMTILASCNANRLTALFLATKTTNNPISLESYTSRIPRTAQADVLDLEFLVAQSLGFDFSVWHAHRALWGLWLDMQVRHGVLCSVHQLISVQTVPDILMEDLRNAHDEALGHIRAVRLTDAELIYTPSQIALACLDIASPALARAWARTKVSSPQSSPPAGEEDDILSILEPIKSMITTQGQLPDVEAVREVDRRLRLCKNPEKVVGSNAYNKKLEEKQRKADEKRKRKADAVRRAMAAGDPFGREFGERDDFDDDDDDD